MDLVEYRFARPSDLDAIVELEARCFETPWTRENLRSELTRTGSQVELTLARGLGLVGLSCVWTLGEEWQLQRIETDPRVRGNGLGTEMLSRVIERARSDGEVRTVTLEVASANASAIDLYVRAGFGEVGRRPGYYRTPPDDAVLMTLEL